MNSEINKIQLNQTIATKTGNLLINIREDVIEKAVELYEGVMDMIKVGSDGNVQIIIPNSNKYYRPSLPLKKNDDYPVIEEVRQCIICGADMVERMSKKGNQFWGCSAYPKCNHTES